MNKINKILIEQLALVKPNNEELKLIEDKAKEIISKINKSLKKLKIKAKPFIGGSLAKRTIVKKEVNDVDIFIRFDKEEKIVNFEKVMKGLGEEYRMVHGSRDYAQIKKNNLLFEIIPTLKVSSPKKAKNITDLSYFHVNYVERKINKNKRLADEIILTKSLLHGAGCYGAESYIKGFSGYSVELLIIHYKTLMNFVKAVIKYNDTKVTSLKDKTIKEKIIIDTEKLYRGKKVMREINEAKLSSPIILIDPTYKERNALAALSIETFIKFQEHCKKFLKNPSLEFFKQKTVDPQKIWARAVSEGKEYGIIEITTNKQSGDIAGTKLLKFSKLFVDEMKRYYLEPEITFEYDEGQKAKIYFIGKKIGEKIIHGPPKDKIDGCIAFREKYKKLGEKVYEHNGILMVEIKIDMNLKEAISEFKKMHNKTMKEMGITEIKILEYYDSKAF